MVRVVISLAFLGALFVHTYGYTVPAATVKAFDDNYYKIEIPVATGISKVTFYINLNTPLETIDQAGSSAANYDGDGSATYRWPDSPIKKGDIINYIVVVEKDGEVYTSAPGSFEVKEILPKSKRTL